MIDIDSCDYCGKAIGFYGCPTHGTDCYKDPVEQFLEVARNGPECFKCQKPIEELNDVRVITVRIDGEPKDVWVHADHAKP